MSMSWHAYCPFTMTMVEGATLTDQHLYLSFRRDDLELPEAERDLLKANKVVADGDDEELKAPALEAMNLAAEVEAGGILAVGDGHRGSG